MKKIVLVIFVLTSFVTMSFVITKDDPIYKNLKILPKKITKEQMDSVMKHFTTSLNVKCNFCHVRTADNKEWDHASDANKHKLVARNMMKMTDQINKKYFDVGTGKGLGATYLVTCYTCHNGKADPEVKPQAQQNRQRQQGDSTRRS